MAKNKYRAAAEMNDSWTSYFFSVMDTLLSYATFIPVTNSQDNNLCDDPLPSLTPIPTPTMTKETKLKVLGDIFLEIDNLWPKYSYLLEQNEDHNKSVENYVKVLNFYKETVKDWMLNFDKIYDQEIHVLEYNVEKLGTFSPLTFDCQDMETFNTRGRKNNFLFFSVVSATQSRTFTNSIAPPCNLGFLR